MSLLGFASILQGVGSILGATKKSSPQMTRTDYDWIMASAKKHGFNPLTLIRNGAQSSNYSVSGALSSQSFLANALTGVSEVIQSLPDPMETKRKELELELAQVEIDLLRKDQGRRVEVQETAPIMVSKPKLASVEKDIEKVEDIHLGPITVMGRTVMPKPGTSSAQTVEDNIGDIASEITAPQRVWAYTQPILADVWKTQVELTRARMEERKAKQKLEKRIEELKKKQRKSGGNREYRHNMPILE